MKRRGNRFFTGIDLFFYENSENCIVSFTNYRILLPVQRKLKPLQCSVRIFADLSEQMQVYSKRFMISWIAAAVIMFGCSYLWHGVVLNDYERIHYPRGIFLTAAAFVYLFVSILLVRLYHVRLLDKISLNPLIRGPIAGVVTGLMVYMIAIVIGVAANYAADFQYMLFDVIWQAIEQTIGGLVTGLVFFFIYEPEPVAERIRSNDAD